MVSTTARYSRLSSITWAIFIKILLRLVADDLPQVTNALWAASIAFSTSFALPLAAFVKTLPSMGDGLSKYSPFSGATHFPPM